jgi:hypothetical protein
MLLIVAAVMALAGSEPTPTPTANPPTTEGAASPAAPDAKHKPKRTKDPNQVVCEDTTEMGSMISHQVCATRDEWARRSRRDQEELGRVRDESGYQAGGDGR